MEFIIDTKPIIKDVDKMKFLKARDKINIAPLSKQEIETILDFYTSLIRRALASELNIDIESDPLINKCDLCQILMGKSLEKIGVTCYPQETQKTINKDCLGHSFLIAIFNGNIPYLIDLSYRQFFIKENCDVERLKMEGDLVIDAPDPGCFCALRDEMMNTASSILENGYVELTDENAKHYGDSFYFSKRGRSGYSNISGSVYKNSFLKENHTYSMSEEKLSENGFTI